MRRILKHVPRGSAVLAATTFASYVLGLFRDRFFAQTFGASRDLDAYNAAFLFPDLIFNILIAGGIAAAFIPILTELNHSGRNKAREYANSIIAAATGTMLVIGILVFIFAGKISAAVAPGFSPEDRLLVAQIMRLLAVSPIFFAASNALGAMLVTEKRFFFYGLSPVFYNLGIILGTLFLSPDFGIMGVAIGTTFGAFLHLMVRLFDAWRHGFRFSLAWKFWTPEFRKTVRLMLPKMFGHPIELATFWGFTAIASTLSAGSVAVIGFARNFQSVPVSLVGITIATTSFPVLAGAISERSTERFWHSLRGSFFLISAISVFSAIFIYILREPLISLFLGGGAFQTEDIRRTAATLGVFCLSIPTEASVHLLARAFYATKNTTIPVAVSFLGIIIAIPGGYFLSLSYGLAALPFAFFLGSAVELLILGILLPIRIKKIMS